MIEGFLGGGDWLIGWVRVGGVKEKEVDVVNLIVTTVDIHYHQRTGKISHIKIQLKRGPRDAVGWDSGG